MRDFDVADASVDAKNLDTEAARDVGMILLASRRLEGLAQAGH